jgi:phosphoribosylaminoimidazolecarboxamide formyltransferase/IMP cyclohydrolase
VPDFVPIRRALISVSDKSDVIPFARFLHTSGIEIISTGGTAAALKEAGVPTTPVEDLTGFPEMMDGRVKTLHPSIHGGLLARRDVDSHVAAMIEHDIKPIDLICINLYPFERTIANMDTTEEEAIEQIDIGGPAMLRSAAKNHSFVTTVTSPSQYDSLISDMHANDGATSLHLRKRLAASAFARTAGYDAAISNWLARSTDESLPPRLQVSATRSASLRYGENPHQQAAMYVLPGTGEAGIASAETIDGKPLSYNNLNDAAAAWRCCGDLIRASNDQAAAVVMKHANPCGASIASTATEAFEAAYIGDPVAAFGGILGLSHPVNAALAAAITTGQRFLEVIVAPSFDQDAVECLTGKWKNIRLVATPDIGKPTSNTIQIRSIPGGLLAQTADLTLANPSKWQHAAGPSADDALRDSAIVAMTAVKHAGSNAITIAGGGRLLGLGSGQVDRLTASRIAVQKAGDSIAKCSGIVAGSDAFFPFPDGPEVLIDAGVTCIVQPGGSKRDDETFALCNERGVTCLVTGTRHFRH